MKKKKININSDIINILKDNNFNNFKVTELRDACFALRYSVDSSLLRMNIYRQLQKLVKLGFLCKIGDKYSPNIIYRKTLEFENTFGVNNVIIDVNSSQITDEELFNKLEKRLEETEIDLLAYEGESEEYLRLSIQYPELKNNLQTKYKYAKEKASKLQGQLKALQSLVSTGFCNSNFDLFDNPTP